VNRIVGPLALALAAFLVPAAGAATLRASDALARELARAGRAEATLRYLVASPAGAARAVHATLALEPPDRVRVDVGATGEKLVARSDGGEWVQPATRQVVRFAAQRSAAALRWWRVLLATDAPARERRIANDRWVVTLLDGRGQPADSAEVWLDTRGLPARLVVPAGDPDAAVYRLGGWRFMRSRGAAAFHLAVPAGYEAVEAP
jgi:hypothetical protein